MRRPSTTPKPLDLLNAAIARAETLAKAGHHTASAVLLEKTIAQLRSRGLADETSGDVFDTIGLAATDAGIARFTSGDFARAEANYELAVTHETSAAAHNLMLMAAETHRDWPRTLERCDAYYEGFCYSDDVRIAIARFRATAHAMLGHDREALDVLADLKTRYAARDNFAQIMTTTRETMSEAGATSGGIGGAVLSAIDAHVATWTDARAVKTPSPRAWWDALEPTWKIVLLAQPGKGGDDRQIPHVADPTVTDARLAKIMRLERVVIFTVARRGKGALGEYATPESLAPLAQLTELHEVDASGTRKPYSIAPLAGLRHLQKLNLDGVKLDDLRPLAHHPALEELVLRDTEVTDLSPLTTIPRLRSLSCWRTPVEDLSPLDRCVELRELIAGNTQARTLPPLGGATKLVFADFSFARFPRKDLNAFKRAHPLARVEYSQAK